MDMAGSLVKNDEEGKGTIALWQDFRAFLDEEFPDAAMISERSTARSCRKEFDSLDKPLAQ